MKVVRSLLPIVIGAGILFYIITHGVDQFDSRLLVAAAIVIVALLWLAISKALPVFRPESEKASEYIAHLSDGYLYAMNRYVRPEYHACDKSVSKVFDLPFQEKAKITPNEFLRNPTYFRDTTGENPNKLVLLKPGDVLITYT